jgi:hypothetical protein
MTDDAFDLADLDGTSPSGAAPVRDRVTFRAADGSSPRDAAEDFGRWLKADAKAHGSQIRARVHSTYSGAVSARVYWSGGRFHTVGFKALEGGRLLARHNGAGGRALSRLLHEWLIASGRFTDPCWRTDEAFRAGQPGEPAP